MNKASTAADARKAIEAEGYTSVRDLKQDNKQAWHGKATKDGKTVDVSLDATGKVIPCPNVPLAQRPVAWQLWAAVLDRHPALRDGGDFQGRRDVVHCELVGWNVLTHEYTR